jgi:hypothetical protein
MKKYTAKYLQEFAISKGGLLLSNKYINCKLPLLWQCKEGHTWITNWDCIHNDNNWCPSCSKVAVPKLQTLQQFAISKKGILLSVEYKTAKTLLSWKCEYGHAWQASWTNVNHKTSPTWCPVCAKKSKPNLIILQQHAISLGGSLLSTAYTNNKTKLSWKCIKGHLWKATWGHIKQDKWCPDCASFKTEKKVKTILSKYLNISFIKTRFVFNNKRYEFDGYNEEHKIAFEYHGYQHYVYPNHWHKTEEIFKNAQQNDLNKEQYCKENNIRLIVIPYTEEKNLEFYIRDMV